MSYLLPKLSALRPDDILELRSKVSDTREGFAFHLQKLTKGISEQLVEGTDIHEVNRWAANLVYHDLIPDYREFRAQLQAGEGWLDKAGRVFEISASPWTPKFYGDLLRALGVPLRTFEEQKKWRSHESRAFQFMQAVEESKVAKYQRGH
jgi:hypothetical protein